MEQESKGKIELIIAMVLSGTIGVFVLESGQPSYNAVFFRCLFGAICLIGFCWYKGYLNFSQLSKKSLALILVGGVAIVLNWVLLFESYSHASISISTVAYHTQPMFVVIFATLFLGEKLLAHKFFWIALAFSGVILIVNPTGSTVNQEDIIYGIMLAISAAILYAIATLIIKQLSGIKPHFIAALQISLGALLLLPFVDMSVVATTGSHWNWLIGLGVIHTCIMYILLYSSFQKVSTSSIAVLSYIYPVVAILFDYVIYEQSLSVVQFIGIAMIIIAGLGNNMNINIFTPFIRNKRQPSI
jgi:drug/metabolite transporter (DMT)-like permease